MVLLIDQGLRHLESLNLSHSLRIPLLTVVLWLAWLLLLLVLSLPHGRYLRLEEGAVVRRFDVAFIAKDVTACYHFLAHSLV